VYFASESPTAKDQSILPNPIRGHVLRASATLRTENKVCPCSQPFGSASSPGPESAAPVLPPLLIRFPPELNSANRTPSDKGSSRLSVDVTFQQMNDALVFLFVYFLFVYRMKILTESSRVCGRAWVRGQGSNAAVTAV
jgi:hypothetical protein